MFFSINGLLKNTSLLFVDILCNAFANQVVLHGASESLQVVFLHLQVELFVLDSPFLYFELFLAELGSLCKAVNRLLFFFVALLVAIFCLRRFLSFILLVHGLDAQLTSVMVLEQIYFIKVLLEHLVHCS